MKAILPLFAISLQKTDIPPPAGISFLFLSHAHHILKMELQGGAVVCFLFISLGNVLKVLWTIHPVMLPLGRSTQE